MYMTANQETALTQEMISMLQAAFKGLKPEEKKLVIEKTTSRVTVTIGFQTNEPGVIAIPLDVASRGLPERMVEAILQVLPKREFNFIGVPEDIVPENPCVGVEWYGFLEAWLAAIPKNDMKVDLESYIKAAVPSHGDVLNRAAIQAILAILEPLSGQEISGPKLVGVDQAVIEAFLENAPAELHDEEKFTQVMYALSDFTTMYLCDIDVRQNSYAIQPNRVAALH